MKTKGVGRETEVDHVRDHVFEGTPHNITTAVDGPRTEYRATIPITVAVPTPETSVVLDPSAARLAGTFAFRDAVVDSGSLSQKDGLVVVTVPEPREVRRVAFTSGSGFSGSTVQLFRLDEETVAPKPTVTANVGGSNAASFGTGAFADVRFAVGVDGKSVTVASLAGVTVRGYPTGPRIGLADPAQPDDVTFFWPGSDDTGNDVDAGAELAAALQAFLGARTGPLNVTLVLQSDQPCTFYLRRLVTGASFALDGFGFPLLGPGDLLDDAALSARIHAAADAVSAHLRAVLNGASLADGLNEVIAADALYDAQRFTGVQLSDATQAALTGTDLARRNRLLLQDAYPDLIAAPGADRVLRFAGDSVQRLEVAVSLPSGAHVTKASVATDESLRSDRAAGGAASAAPTGRSGVHVDPDAAVAIAAQVAAATSATGVALDLLPLADGAKLSVELQDDFQGSPSGKRLAGGAITLADAGVATRATVFFDAVVLPAGSVWVVLKAAKGHAVWVGTPAATDVRVVRTPGGEAVFPGLSVAVTLFTRSGAAADAPALSLAVGGAGVTGEDGAYDLSAVLASAADGTVTLTFSSAVGGSVTVHPPHIEYSV